MMWDVQIQIAVVVVVVAERIVPSSKNQEYQHEKRLKRRETKSQQIRAALYSSLEPEPGRSPRAADVEP